MSALDQIAGHIIKEQELIIGPIAWSTARSVHGLTVVDETSGSVSLDTAHGKEVVDALVHQYEALFGRAARETCREATVSLVADLPKEEVPASLR